MASRQLSLLVGFPADPSPLALPNLVPPERLTVVVSYLDSFSILLKVKLLVVKSFLSLVAVETIAPPFKSTLPALT